MGEEIELVGLYWTVSGPVEVHTGREWSLFDLSERCAQAARVGFSGLGLWHADIEHQLETRSLADMRAIFDDSGVRAVELEFLADFFVDPGDDRRTASDATRRLLFDAAAALDAHHIKVGNIPGTPCELDLLTERYAELCADAAEHTDARIVYEFMPFDVNVHDLDSALAVVQGAGAANGGLVVDTFHLAKLDIAPDDLRRIPLEYLTWIELSDGAVGWAMDDHVEETVNHRKLPGEGDIDLRAYVDVCRDIGYPGPWGVEVLSAELRALPIEEIFDRAYQTTAAQFTGSGAPAS